MIMDMKSSNEHIKIIAVNRKANFNYFLTDFLECGLVLSGTEIKSLRINNASIGDAYIVFRDSEAYVINMHINPYEQGNIFNKDPLRDRKLLMHKKEIKWFMDKIKQGGFTVIPTKIYFVKGRAKIEIALAKGKKLYDKRETIKKRDDERMISKMIKDKNN